VVNVHRRGQRIVTEDTGASAPKSDYSATLWAEKPEAPSRLMAVLLILLIKFILAVPHVIVLTFYWLAALIVAWIGYWAVLLTGNLPPGFHSFVLGYLRWNWRVNAWLCGIVDACPPFATEADYPADAGCALPEAGNRLLAAARILNPIIVILFIPHLIALWVMAIVATLVFLITPWAVIFTGSFPQFAFDILVGVARWQHRVTCFQLGLVEQYPPFSMSE